jgi:phosphate starvation-inducible membrane PsiE
MELCLVAVAMAAVNRVGIVFREVEQFTAACECDSSSLMMELLSELLFFFIYFFILILIVKMCFCFW